MYSFWNENREDVYKRQGVGYDLAANPNYREEVPYDEVKLMYMGDASAKTMALQSGQVDLVENITLSLIHILLD